MTIFVWHGRTRSGQARSGELLGEILVRQGAITPAQRQGALALRGRGRVARQGRFLAEGRCGEQRGAGANEHAEKTHGKAEP